MVSLVVCCLFIAFSLAFACPIEKKNNDLQPLPNELASSTSLPRLPDRSDQKFTRQMPQPQPSNCGHSKYYTQNSSPNGNSQVFGGTDALPNQYPWLVSIENNNNSSSITEICSGALISDRFVLTSAHCGSSLHTPAIHFAMYQPLKRDPGEFKMRYYRTHIHPQFHPTSFDYDFALIELSSSIDFTQTWKVQPICLPDNCNDESCTSNYGLIAGWGRFEDLPSFGHAKLKHAHVRIDPLKKCEKNLTNLIGHITDRMICASAVGVGACSHSRDRGIPLMSYQPGYFVICGVLSQKSAQSCSLPSLQFETFTGVAFRKLHLERKQNFKKIEL